MNNKKSTISIIALVALTVTMSVPSAFAHTTPVESYYWHTDPETCYLYGELDDIDFEGSRSTSNQDAIVAELEDSRSTYNAEMGTITIRGHDSNSCTDNRRIEVGAYDFGEWWTYGLERTYVSNTEITRSEIDFNTNLFIGYDRESSSCWLLDVDLEWIYNHELGHGIGLAHHTHVFQAHNSIMKPICGSAWAAFSSDDVAAIDIHYP